jgi:hypothetical protein
MTFATHDFIQVAESRSNLLTMGDRHQLEQQHLVQLESGGGALGTTKIDLYPRKTGKFGFIKKERARTIPTEKEFIGLLQSDGLFVDSALVFKNKDINVQKLEERLLNTGQSEYFKIDGQLKLNNDILANELTRPSNLAFEQPDAFQTVENNAIICDRLNSYKKQYYCIDIVLGKLILAEYEQLFTPQDTKMLQLRHLCKLYDRRVSLALIPFYMEKLEFLGEQILLASNAHEKKDQAFLETVEANTLREKDDEIREINKAANDIYELWTSIKDLVARGGEGKLTPFELRVHKGEAGDDVLFNLKYEQLIQTGDQVQKQMDRTKKTLCYCKVLIDGKFVGQTKKTPVTWPNYEVEICDQFLIHVFTLPSKVQLEIVINDKSVDIVDLVIPGHHVRTLTSSSRLIKEYPFSRKERFIEERRKRGVILDKEKSKLTPQEEKELANVDKVNIEGVIFVKAEWQGRGESMPPAKSETLFALSQIEKNRNYYTKEEEYKMLQDHKPIDVNDPRNELILKNMRKMKNDYLDRLYSLDEKFNLYDLESFRHKLLQARMQDPSYEGVPIPQLNHELINGELGKFYLEWLEEVHR